MRLKSIKLAGFKSFVDPTHATFPSRLTAILGPNGCGKSNIIDAVRWVMGESSAKQLRGESMSDVIFSGSTKRKPVGQASIELIFENCEGKIKGEYQSLSEISLRREVIRDGASNYYLNGTRCRKRDITDIFLGTGLGPRSYSIIKQDTISRIIEAKPDELRAHLEEAAGISKYKERRRETLNRIEHARENLARLTDIRQELASQLGKLERQAQAAEKYKIYKADERNFKTQLIALQWHDSQVHIDKNEAILSKQNTALEEAIASQRKVENELEKHRLSHETYNDEYQAAQSIYYELGNEITRNEQQLENTRQRLESLQHDLQQTKTDHDALFALQALDLENQKQLTSNIEKYAPALEQLQQDVEQAQATLQQAESLLQDWQTRWDAFRQTAAKRTQEAHLQQMQLQHIEQSQADTDKRIQVLNEERQQFKFTDYQQAIDDINTQVDTLQVQLQQAQQKTVESETQIQTIRKDNQAHKQALEQAQSEWHQLQGRQASLEALQQAALDIKGNEVKAWLNSQDLQAADRLAQIIKVASGFESAVEMALGSDLQAFCVMDLSDFSDALQHLEEGQVTLYQSGQMLSGEAYPSQTLAAKVQAPQDVLEILSHIHLVSDLATALTRRATLSSQDSFMTQDGLWIGKNWIRIAKKQIEDDSVLRRENELVSLKEKMTTLSQTLAVQQSALQTGEQQLQRQEHLAKEIQAEINILREGLSDHKSQLKIKQARLTQMQTRDQQIQEELTRLQEKQQALTQAYTQTRNQWNAALVDIENQDTEETTLTQEGQGLRDQLQQSRTIFQAHSKDMHDCQVRLESLRSELSVISQNTLRQQQQLDTLKERELVLQRSIEANNEPTQNLQQQLAQYLEKRVAAEANMQQARARLQDSTSQQSDLENQRNDIESNLVEIRGKLETQRLHSHEHQVRQKTLEEQLQPYDLTLASVMENMPEDANMTTWQAEIERLQKRISRLGAINLAAIDEFEELSERKQHLDAQDADLQEALTMLEDAIRKIDIETRQKFKETYDKVNNSFQSFFPKIFGGGAALLELTDNNLLEAGLIVKARPPGKKNSSVHLLSGGEKALTAIALVFSIFQLNPAPFCMLDEVDAPLDDANVMRFSKLVEEMSKDVQFIFITHNKVTMEMAEHLLGVTMHEPGVSRLVSVDVENAMALAEA